jgi:hypothetical protein
MVGRQVKCPSCKATFTVTAAREAPPVLAVAPEYAPPAPVSGGGMAPSGAGEYKECPFCGEQVRANAKKCKHCGETIDVALRAAEEARRTAEKQHGRNPMVFMNAGGGGASSSSAAASSSGGSPYPQTIVHVVRPFPHGVHLLLTILTCGFWLPIWILLAILHKG